MKEKSSKENVHPIFKEWKYVTTTQEIWKKMNEFAKNNRRQMNYPEKLFWSYVKSKQIGLKFRRQQIIGIYIVDFVCLEEKIVIEIDGSSHDDKTEYDKARDEYLRAMDYKILHIRNEDILNRSRNCIIKQIIDLLERKI